MLKNIKEKEKCEFFLKYSLQPDQTSNISQSHLQSSTPTPTDFY